MKQSFTVTSHLLSPCLNLRAQETEIEVNISYNPKTRLDFLPPLHTFAILFQRDCVNHSLGNLTFILSFYNLSINRVHVHGHACPCYPTGKSEASLQDLVFHHVGSSLMNIFPHLCFLPGPFQFQGAGKPFAPSPSPTLRHHGTDLGNSRFPALARNLQQAMV